MVGKKLNGARNGKLLPAALTPALEVHGLEVAYGRHTVLRDVHGQFPDRSVTAIMGPSGCGKSTLVKVLNRTLELIPKARVVRGTVAFRGQDIHAPHRDPKVIRERIGIIHQKPITFPMSILENVLFGARFHGRINGTPHLEYARRYLDRVGLLEEVETRLHSPASRLSGGQQQRLCLARTLANQPEVILMDEPCSAIDPLATQRIEALIRELKRDYAIVIVTHNLGQAQRVSDQAMILFDGRVVEAGPTARLFAEPRTELARNFLSGRIG